MNTFGQTRAVKGRFSTAHKWCKHHIDSGGQAALSLRVLGPAHVNPPNVGELR